MCLGVRASVSLKVTMTQQELRLKKKFNGKTVLGALGKRTFVSGVITVAPGVTAGEREG